ncbi:hypothetical protein EHS25_003798 [Saitozyma podzolica]|uniref:Choline transporter n=1 Tax=Saitozyma podzolica TaxID=1890683 RepID=A0A427Y3K0_9TREE|nr:hypothetical protein EHS25_003798 [Saitozyma podzolica]
MAFAMLNSWTGLLRGLQVVLPSGGSVSMIWGLLVSTIGTFAMALSLAEVCHVYPTTGGQYDWTYFLAPPGSKRSLSFFVGWMASAGWIALVATGSSLGSTFVTNIISLWSENYTAERWQTFLIYFGFTIGALLLNLFAVRLLPLVDRAGFYWSLAGILIVTITLLARSSGNYQPAQNVFAEFVNETGWPDGIAFILGLLQSTFGLTGFDAISHMVEEMPRPSITAPKVMLMAVGLGASTSLVFMIVLLFCLTDLPTVLASPTGPLLQIYYQATRSMAGATGLVIFNLMAMVFATQGLMTVASRIVLPFARDQGFGPLSKSLREVHPTLKVPVWSISFVSAWTVIFGLIYLGSSVALNAILSASVVFMQISYIVPIFLLCWRGEAALENEQRVWSLGRFRRRCKRVSEA